jgi:hypothetical protein
MIHYGWTSATQQCVQIYSDDKPALGYRGLAKYENW